MDCIYCNQNSGDRECPALGGYICSRCCGKHRGIKINCPPDCHYFKKHEQYQQSKQAETYQEKWVDNNQDIIENDNRELLHLLVTLDYMISARYEEEQTTTLTNKTIIDAAKGIKRRLKPIEVPGQSPSDFEQFLWNGFQSLKEEDRVSTDDLKEIIQRFLSVVEDYPEDSNSRDLVQGIVGHVKENLDLPEPPPQDESNQKLISTPGKLLQELNR